MKATSKVDSKVKASPGKTKVPAAAIAKAGAKKAKDEEILSKAEPAGKSFFTTKSFDASLISVQPPHETKLKTGPVFHCNIGYGGTPEKPGPCRLGTVPFRCSGIYRNVNEQDGSVSYGGSIQLFQGWPERDEDGEELLTCLTAIKEAVLEQVSSYEEELGKKPGEFAMRMNDIATHPNITGTLRPDMNRSLKVGFKLWEMKPKTVPHTQPSAKMPATKTKSKVTKPSPEVEDESAAGEEGKEPTIFTTFKDFRTGQHKDLQDVLAKPFLGAFDLWFKAVFISATIVSIQVKAREIQWIKDLPREKESIANDEDYVNLINKKLEKLGVFDEAPVPAPAKSVSAAIGSSGTRTKKKPSPLVVPEEEDEGETVAEEPNDEGEAAAEEEEEEAPPPPKAKAKTKASSKKPLKEALEDE